jgi:hypothetical protein
MRKSIFLTLVILSVIVPSFALASTMTIRPNGQGNYVGWSNTGCGSGSNEWKCVDENPANTSDYLYTSSKNTKESFAFQDTGLGTVTINSVTLYYYAKYYSSSKYRIQPLIRSSSTDYLGNIYNVSSSYAYISQAYATNPATGSAWTKAQVDALEAGMNSYNSNNGGGYVAQTYAVIDYVIPDSCSDTDGGNWIWTFGTTSGYLSEVYYSHSDYCVDASNINEYYCSGNYEQSQQQSCGTDYYGPNYCNGSSIYFKFYDYYCGSGRCYLATIPQFVQSCPNGCLNGTCSDSCSDTDGGQNVMIQGNVSGFYNHAPYRYADSCASGTTVNEYYCYANHQYSSVLGCPHYYTRYCVGSTAYTNETKGLCASGACYLTRNQTSQYCENGCSYGLCIMPDSCNDTDGGLVYNTQGTVSGYRYNYPYSYTDACNGTTILREFYCNGAAWTSTNYACPANESSTCVNGACT